MHSHPNLAILIFLSAPHLLSHSINPISSLAILPFSSTPHTHNTYFSLPRTFSSLYLFSQNFICDTLSPTSSLLIGLSPCTSTNSTIQLQVRHPWLTFYNPLASYSFCPTFPLPRNNAPYYTSSSLKQFRCSSGKNLGTTFPLKILNKKSLYEAICGGQEEMLREEKKKEEERKWAKKEESSN